MDVNICMTFTNITNHTNKLTWLKFISEVVFKWFVLQTSREERCWYFKSKVRTLNISDLELLPFSSPVVWAPVHAEASTPSCPRSWCRCPVTWSRCSNASAHLQPSDTETFSQRPSPEPEGRQRLWRRWMLEWELTEAGTEARLLPQSPFYHPQEHPGQQL